MKNTEENSEKIGKIQKKGKLKSENILKMWKKIVKWYEKYGRKVSWMWIDLENTEENSER